MEKKKIVDTIKLENGECIEKKFKSYLEMAKYAVDWTLFCHYKLRVNCVDGLFKILKLTNMQVSYTKEVGGIMYNYASPKESINISILINVEDKASLQEMKVQTDMVIITQSEKIYNFITNRGVEIIDISCSKDDNSLLYNRLKPYVDKFFYDYDKKIQTELLTIFETYTEERLDIPTVQTIEKKITDAIINSIDIQKVNIPSFTKSESIALTIREQLFNHMDSTVSVETLATQYKISEKSLQTAFKSLYGFTPSIFIRLMKLNLVYHELLQSSPSTEITILRVAQKWGFKHMGRFSGYYKELFLELPSDTLQRDYQLSNGMSVYCVERKDEI